MTSEKQARANRRNALKSTGPKTPEGKAAVHHNALRHELLSRDVLLPGEDEAALKELSERLRDELQPVGALESLLVERIISVPGGCSASAGLRPAYSPTNSLKLEPYVPTAILIPPCSV